MPDSIRGMVERKIGKLAPELRELLEAASVQGAAVPVGGRVARHANKPRGRRGGLGDIGPLAPPGAV